MAELSSILFHFGVRRAVRVLWLTLLMLAGLLGAGVVWLNADLSMASERADLGIEPGTSVRDVAQSVADAGVQVNPAWLYWWFRLSGDDRKIKAGNYELERPVTPRSLLKTLVRGEEAWRAVTLVEGWNFRQVLTTLSKTEHLTPTLQGLEHDLIMKKLGRPGLLPEGRFFPDTYTYAKGSTDLAVLQRAMRVMDKKLAAAWLVRASDTPLSTPDQALTLASIIEKETGRAGDRGMIAGVFSNRLRVGMMLQTDPTVIYGLGEAFDGNLRKRDLRRDTPWNTYTRAGLPATPIAMPGNAALLAAVQPASTNALYFVARGDGTSQFSDTLDEHNRAVNKYQRGQ